MSTVCSTQLISLSTAVRIQQHTKPGATPPLGFVEFLEGVHVTACPETGLQLRCVIVDI